MSGYNVAVVGATGLVGEAIISILEERNFPVENIVPLASARSVGREVSYRDERIPIVELESFDFGGMDFCFFSAGADISSKFVPIATEQGAIAIDNTSAFRYEDDVPLVVPEVNVDALASYTTRNIIANPNCSTIQLVVALAPIHKIARIKRINVATYQSVSGAGKEAMDELFKQTQDIYKTQPTEKKQFTKQIAFNAIPHIGSFIESGDTKEEEKMVNETKKILDPGIRVSATCVRIPVFISHAESINIEFDSPLSDKKATELLKNFQGISVIDYRKDEGYITPIEAAGEDKVYVSRVRNDVTIDNGLNLWVVADNLRKGAALNTVQIAELVVSKYSSFF